MNYKAIIKRQSTVIAIAVICLTLATIGVSFALFFQVETNTNNQVVTAGTLNVEYGSGSSAIAATELVPMSDDEALASNTMTGTIYVENKGTLPASYEVALGNDTESFNNRSNALETDELLNHDYIKVAAYLNGTMVVEPTTLSELKASENGAEMYKLFTGSLDTTGSGNSTMTVVIKVWIDESAPEDIIGNFVYLKMDITSEVLETNLKYKIIAHAEKNNYLYTTAPNFNNITAEREYGLYTAADDYGLSYYFRGDVENNYVEFGDYLEQDAGYVIPPASMVYDTLEECESSYYVQDYHEKCYKTGGDLGDKMYWRIVRINGDGTIRLVYDGTIKTENTADDNAIIKFSPSDFSIEPKYINQPSKERLDLWYAKHLNNSYSQYISDTVFCNDNTLRYIYYDDNFEETSDVNSPYIREVFGAQDRLNNNPKPILTCTNQSDRYTVEDTINGNGVLSKPIGLMTADEIAMAGGVVGTRNDNYYLNSNMTALSMTPYGQDGPKNYAYTYTYVYGKALTKMEDGFNPFDYLIGVRPVINIKADVEFIGSGTIDDPYQIKELAE